MGSQGARGNAAAELRGVGALGKAKFFQPEPDSDRSPFRLSTTLWGIDRTFNMNVREILGVLPSLGEGMHEFMFHPRRVEGDPDTRALVELRDHI